MLAFCTRCARPPLSGISIRRAFFCPLKVQIHVELLFSFLHPRCPNTDVRRVGRTGGWTEEEH